MKSQKGRTKRHVGHSISDDLDSASPPAPSKNGDFRLVHDEIPMLQNVARVYLGIVLESISNGRPASWPKFITDSTPHRDLSSNEEIENFLKSKLLSPRRR